MARELEQDLTIIRTDQETAEGAPLGVLEAALVLVCLCWLLPGTWISATIDSVLVCVITIFGISREAAHNASYGIGILSLTGLLTAYAHGRAVRSALSPQATRLAGAMALFSGLYLADFFFSTAKYFDYAERCWSFFALAPFFVVILYCNSVQTMRLVRTIALITGLRAALAVWVLLAQQRHIVLPFTGSGAESGSALPDAPCALYLLGAALCAVLGASAEKSWMRKTYAACSAANLIALAYTYSGPGWFGLALALCIVLVARLWLQDSVKTQRLMIPIALILLSITAVAIAGWERQHIGAMYAQIIKAHPLVGSGLATHDSLLSTAVTQESGGASPSAIERSPLYLVIWAEFGAIGFALLLFACYRFWQFCCGIIRGAESEARSWNERTGAIIGIAAGSIAVAVAALVDTPILRFNRVPDTLALALLLGAACGLDRKVLPSEHAATTLVRPRFRRAGWAVVAVGAVSLAWIGASAALLVHRASPILAHYVPELTHPPFTNIPLPLPGAVSDALVAMEDRNFYAHHGVDWEALHRTLRKDVRGEVPVQGGSTITMQAVRYVMLPYDKTPARKLAQIVLALRLERRLSKQQILTLYFNSVTFGVHTAGLQSAALTYFEKQPENLSLGEIAFLVGTISHPPSSIKEVTPEFARQRADAVLDHMEPMFEEKYGQQTFEQARRAELHFAWQKLPRSGCPERLK